MRKGTEGRTSAVARIATGVLSSTAEPSWLDTTTSPGRRRWVFAKGDAALLLEVVAHAPFAIDPNTGRVDLAGELTVGVPVLIVGGGEAEAERELDGEGGSEPAGGKSGNEEGNGRGDRQQVAGGAGVENGEARGRRRCRSRRAGSGCRGRGACARRGWPRRAGAPGKTIQQAWIDEHRGIGEFRGESLKAVGREVAGEDGGGRGPRREALEKLEGGDGERRDEEDAGTPVEKKNRGEENGLI